MDDYFDNLLRELQDRENFIDYLLLAELEDARPADTLPVTVHPSYDSEEF